MKKLLAITIAIVMATPQQGLALLSPEKNTLRPLATECMGSEEKVKISRGQFIKTATAAAIGIATFLAGTDFSNEELERNVKFYFMYHGYPEDVDEFADDLRAEVEQAQREGYTPVCLSEQAISIPGAESYMLSLIKSIRFIEAFLLPEEAFIEQRDLLMEQLDGIVEFVMLMETRDFKEIYEAMQEDGEEDARRISEGLEPLPASEGKVAKFFKIPPGTDTRTEFTRAKHKLSASLKTKVIFEDVGFKNSLRLALRDAIESLAIEKVLEDRNVSRYLSILRMAWELEAIIHKDREDRIKAQIESIYEDGDIKNPAVFITIGLGHHNMHADYSDKNYHTSTWVPSTFEGMPRFLRDFPTELIRGNPTEQEVKRSVLLRIVHPGIYKSLKEHGDYSDPDKSLFLALGVVLDRMPLERVELMFQETLESLEPEADFDKFLADVLIWLRQNEMTEKDRKAIFENLEEKRSKPSPAQGNIKGGSGINPGLLPAATSVLFRQRAITAVINSAA